MKKRELAQELFPDKSADNAVKTLTEQVRRCPELEKKLTAGGRKFFRCRDLTVRQAMTIREYLCYL